MVYHQKFVALLRNAVNGKVLREVDGACLIPFGTEYTIQLKNMNSRRVVVKISIDGTDVLNGQRLILSANETTEVEGYLGLDGRVSHRFKFIEKTAKISDHRGDKVDDGLLRIEYQYEAEVPEVKHVVTYQTTYHRHDRYGWGHWFYPPYSGTPVWRGGTPESYTFGQLSTSKSEATENWERSTGRTPKRYKDVTKGGPRGASASDVRPISAHYDQSKTSAGMAPMGFAPHTYSANSINTLSQEEVLQKRPWLNDTDSIEGATAASVKDGITVKGSASNQTFKYGSVGALEENSHVIVLQLKGTMPESGTLVKEAVEVKTKLKCDTCGRNCKSNQKFCPDCGTSLL